MSEAKVENRHFDAVQRLHREFFGGEPYSPAVMPFARLLAAHEAEVLARENASAFLRGACLALVAKWREEEESHSRRSAGRVWKDNHERQVALARLDGLVACADELEALVKP